MLNRTIYCKNINHKIFYKIHNIVTSTRYGCNNNYLYSCQDFSIFNMLHKC